MNNTAKLYSCKKCGFKVPILSKGLCSRCYYIEYANKKLKMGGKKKPLDKNNKIKYYYLYHLNNIKSVPYCENCGIKLQGSISNIAHILPKRQSANPEVGAELNNYMYLCSPFDNLINNCHSKYDRIQATKDIYLMNCFNIAKQRYLTFCNKVRYTKYSKVFDECI